MIRGGYGGSGLGEPVRERRAAQPRRGPPGPLRSLDDNQILLAIMVLVRDGHPAAVQAHNRFLADNDQFTFLSTARALLAGSRNNIITQQFTSTPAYSANNDHIRNPPLRSQQHNHLNGTSAGPQTAHNLPRKADPHGDPLAALFANMDVNKVNNMHHSSSAYVQQQQQQQAAAKLQQQQAHQQQQQQQSFMSGAYRRDNQGMFNIHETAQAAERARARAVEASRLEEYQMRQQKAYLQHLQQQKLAAQQQQAALQQVQEQRERQRQQQPFSANATSHYGGLGNANLNGPSPNINANRKLAEPLSNFFDTSSGVMPFDLGGPGPPLGAGIQQQQSQQPQSRFSNSGMDSSSMLLNSLPHMNNPLQQQQQQSSTRGPSPLHQPTESLRQTNQPPLSTLGLHLPQHPPSTSYVPVLKPMQESHEATFSRQSPPQSSPLANHAAALGRLFENASPTPTSVQGPPPGLPPPPGLQPRYAQPNPQTGAVNGDHHVPLSSPNSQLDHLSDATVKYNQSTASNGINGNTNGNTSSFHDFLRLPQEPPAPLAPQPTRLSHSSSPTLDSSFLASLNPSQDMMASWLSHPSPAGTPPAPAPLNSQPEPPIASPARTRIGPPDNLNRGSSGTHTRSDSPDTGFDDILSLLAQAAPIGAQATSPGLPGQTGNLNAELGRSLIASPLQVPSGSIKSPASVTTSGEEAVTDSNGHTEGGETEGSIRKPKRTNKKQLGRLWVRDPAEQRSGGALRSVRPKANVYVDWEAPVGLVRGMSKPEIGLFRLGLPTNQGSVISKGMTIPTDIHARDETAYLRGTITYYAPRSPGVFVFRMYDSQDSTDTHATSRSFVVDVQIRDVEPNLRIILSQFKEKRTITALTQLTQLLKSLQPFQPSRTFPGTLWSALHAALLLQEAGSGKDENGRSKHSIQVNIANLLHAVLNNQWISSSLDIHQRSYLRLCESLWCPFLEQFYPTEMARREYCRTHWGFEPSTLPISSVSTAVYAFLSQEINSTVPSLLPSPNFHPLRETIRRRLETLLTALPQFPPGIRLQIFGSSANNFGSDTADLDMCLIYPRGFEVTTPASDLIEVIAGHLTSSGYSDVNPRPTARIPIVLFKDINTGLECDISVENPLALRNTRLLYTYSQIDPRVRALACIVKYWAKQRKINNPSAGTLSSYAYLLMLIHFLQTRRPFPLLPNLQALPPEWTGQEITDPDRLRAYLHSVPVMHPIEKFEVETYFYQPPDGDFAFLGLFANRNKSSVGALLVEFFRYYAWDFDFKSYVVSIRQSGVVKKDEKGEEDCWPLNQRLAIEDPFETWYNVTHFLKESRHRHVRIEFARAYTLCVRAGMEGVGSQGLLLKLCEEAEEKEEEEEPEAEAKEMAAGV